VAGKAGSGKAVSFRSDLAGYRASHFSRPYRSPLFDSDNRTRPLAVALGVVLRDVMHVQACHTVAGRVGGRSACQVVHLPRKPLSAALTQINEKHLSVACLWMVARTALPGIAIQEWEVSISSIDSPSARPIQNSAQEPVNHLVFILSLLCHAIDMRVPSDQRRDSASLHSHQSSCASSSPS
jgi:hypothetical protein